MIVLQAAEYDAYLWVGRAPVLDHTAQKLAWTEQKTNSLMASPPGRALIGLKRASTRAGNVTAPRSRKTASQLTPIDLTAIDSTPDG
jgi:hypothetical protein